MRNLHLSEAVAHVHVNSGTQFTYFLYVLLLSVWGVSKLQHACRVVVRIAIAMLNEQNKQANAVQTYYSVPNPSRL